MTDQGTFIINGAERVVVSQLVRSPGVYYTATEDPATGRSSVQRQGHPQPRRLAGVRDRRPRPALRQGRPQAQARGDQAAARRRATRPTSEMLALFAARRHRRDARYIAATLEQGHHDHAPGSAHRGLQEAAPGRPADRRQRREAGREPVLQLPPLRPRPRRPLQGQQEARPGRRADGHRRCRATERTITQGRHRGHRRPPHRAQQRARPAPTTSTTSATAASAPTAS